MGRKNLAAYPLSGATETTMYQFNVEDMTCGHCVSSVTQAVKAVDSHAEVDISLRDKRVSVRSSAAQDEIAQAIREAGYTPRAA
jgi:copper chaperone